MPRNTTGGSGHKAQKNSEGSKARHNREFIDDLLDDYRKGEKTDGVFVGRILRRMGCGRMEVFYMEEVEEDGLDALANDVFARPKKPKMVSRAVQRIMPMRGGLRGKAKKTVWVDVDSLVMIAETGLAGTTHEIIAVFNPEQVAKFRKLKPDADDRLFLKGGAENTEGEKEMFVFTEEVDEDLDVDNI